MSIKPQFGLSFLLIATAVVAVGIAYYLSPLSRLVITPFLILFGFIAHVILTVAHYRIRRWWPSDDSSRQSEI